MKSQYYLLHIPPIFIFYFAASAGRQSSLLVKITPPGATSNLSGRLWPSFGTVGSFLFALWAARFVRQGALIVSKIAFLADATRGCRVSEQKDSARKHGRGREYPSLRYPREKAWRFEGRGLGLPLRPGIRH